MNEGAGLIAEYHTDWSAAGPLIEKYGITVSFDRGHWIAYKAAFYGASDNNTASNWRRNEWGDSPLVAVCHCILAMKKAGKLEEVSPPIITAYHSDPYA